MNYQAMGSFSTNHSAVFPPSPQTTELAKRQCKLQWFTPASFRVDFFAAAVSGSSKPNPWTLNPTPYMIDPTPWTLNPTPYMIDPTPWTLNPTPYIIDPTP